jgi:hypothetical protein
LTSQSDAAGARDIKPACQNDAGPRLIRAGRYARGVPHRDVCSPCARNPKRVVALQIRFGLRTDYRSTGAQRSVDTERRVLRPKLSGILQGIVGIGDACPVGAVATVILENRSSQFTTLKVPEPPSSNARGSNADGQRRWRGKHLARGEPRTVHATDGVVANRQVVKYVVHPNTRTGRGGARNCVAEVIGSGQTGQVRAGQQWIEARIVEGIGVAVVKSHARNRKSIDQRGNRARVIVWIQVIELTGGRK